jgi:hypothetical protein
MFLWDGNAIIIETCFDGVFVEVNKGFVVGVKKSAGQFVSFFRVSSEMFFRVPVSCVFAAFGSYNLAFHMVFARFCS